jgi:hypothetical protein
MTLPLPSSLKIGSFVYRIKPSNSMDKFGSTDNRSSKIKVSTAQSEGQLRATLLHESLHALLWCAGAEQLLGLNFEAEEKLVRLLEPWLLGLLRDNPEFVTTLLLIDVDPPPPGYHGCIMTAPLEIANAGAE